jgi:hypothetical protein
MYQQVSFLCSSSPSSSSSYSLFLNRCSWFYLILKFIFILCLLYISLCWSQPTWSPLSDRIAVTAFYRDHNILKSSIHTYDYRGRKLSETKTKLPCFYIYWHPDSTRLTFLSNWLPGVLALQYIDYENPKKVDNVSLIEIGRYRSLSRYHHTMIRKKTN